MKRWFFAAHRVDDGQHVGPGSSTARSGSRRGRCNAQAALARCARTPARPSTADPLQGLWNPAGQGPLPTPLSQPLPATPPVDINQDLAVTKELGPWMIFIHSYSGPDAPTLARTMALELRTTHKLPAYVFNYVAEEKRKEFFASASRSRSSVPSPNKTTYPWPTTRYASRRCASRTIAASCSAVTSVRTPPAGRYGRRQET